MPIHIQSDLILDETYFLAAQALSADIGLFNTHTTQIILEALLADSEQERLTNLFARRRQAEQALFATELLNQLFNQFTDVLSSLWAEDDYQITEALPERWQPLLQAILRITHADQAVANMEAILDANDAATSSSNQLNDLIDYFSKTVARNIDIGTDDAEKQNKIHKELTNLFTTHAVSTDDNAQDPADNDHEAAASIDDLAAFQAKQAVILKASNLSEVLHYLLSIITERTSEPNPPVATLLKSFDIDATAFEGGLPYLHDLKERLEKLIASLDQVLDASSETSMDDVNRVLAKTHTLTFILNHWKKRDLTDTPQRRQKKRLTERQQSLKEAIIESHFLKAQGKTNSLQKLLRARMKYRKRMQQCYQENQAQKLKQATFLETLTGAIEATEKASTQALQASVAANQRQQLQFARTREELQDQKEAYARQGMELKKTRKELEALQQQIKDDRQYATALDDTQYATALEQQTPKDLDLEQDVTFAHEQALQAAHEAANDAEAVHADLALLKTANQKLIDTNDHLEHKVTEVETRNLALIKKLNKQQKHQLSLTRKTKELEAQIADLNSRLDSKVDGHKTELAQLNRTIASIRHDLSAKEDMLKDAQAESGTQQQQLHQYKSLVDSLKQQLTHLTAVEADAQQKLLGFKGERAKAIKHIQAQHKTIQALKQTILRLTDKEKESSQELEKLMTETDQVSELLYSYGAHLQRLQEDNAALKAQLGQCTLGSQSLLKEVMATGMDLEDLGLTTEEIARSMSMSIALDDSVEVAITPATGKATFTIHEDDEKPVVAATPAPATPARGDTGFIIYEGDEDGENSDKAAVAATPTPAERRQARKPEQKETPDQGSNNGLIHIFIDTDSEDEFNSAAQPKADDRKRAPLLPVRNRPNDTKKPGGKQARKPRIEILPSPQGKENPDQRSNKAVLKARHNAGLHSKKKGRQSRNPNHLPTRARSGFSGFRF
jgi:hypothetical protein